MAQSCSSHAARHMLQIPLLRHPVPTEVFFSSFHKAVACLVSHRAPVHHGTLTRCIPLEQCPLQDKYFQDRGTHYLAREPNSLMDIISFVESTSLCNLCFLSPSGIYRWLSYAEFLLQAKVLYLPPFKTCPHNFALMRLPLVCNSLEIIVWLWEQGVSSH